MMTNEQWINFFIQIVATLVGAFVGAGLAFLFNWLHYKRQKDEADVATLSLLVSCLFSIINSAYNFKEQIVNPRHKEGIACKEILNKGYEQSQIPHIQIQYMSKYLYYTDLEWPMAQEKLVFLATQDPNVIMLIGAAREAILSFNTTICDINDDIRQYMKVDQNLDIEIIKIMIDKNRILYEQLDNVLYLTKKLADALVIFGGREYKKKGFSIKGMIFSEKYKSLLPKPIESWEGYEWFPKKKKWWQSKTEGIKT